MPLRKRLVNGLLRSIDSEGVLLFQVVFYIILSFVGAQNLLAGGGGPLTLHGTMGGMSVMAWNWANLSGPAICLLGKVVEFVNPPTVPAEDPRDDDVISPAFEEGVLRPGRWLQLLGDIGISWALGAYTVGTFHTEPVGVPGYGGYLGLATWLSTVVLTFRDLRRLLGKEVAP